jgi:excisionase family DNA binding protein
VEKTMPDLKEYIQTTEAAAQLNYHVEHVRRMMREGSLVGIKIGRTWLVQKKSLDEYVARMASMSKHVPRRTQ